MSAQDILITKPTTSKTDRVRLKVFISYSRADKAFADQLVEGLEFDGGFDVMIDRFAIHEGEDWRARLSALIAECDTVVFVLTPASAGSHVCGWEVEEALRLSKRIVPVQAAPVANDQVTPALAALNYVRFDDGRSLIAGLAGLRRALNTDLVWMREHTRLLIRAQEWNKASRPENRLLTGTDIAAAKQWLEQHPKDAPEPTELHRVFIHSSDQAETTRLSGERQRAEALQRAVTMMRWALVVALALAIAAGGAGLWAKRQQQEAEKQHVVAEENTKKSQELLDLLLTNLEVAWPADDSKSPDYRHVAGTPLGKALKGLEFDVTMETIRLLLRANDFNPVALDDKIIIALRGAQFHREPNELWSTRIQLADVRPDHRTFRSIFIVADLKNGQLAAFKGATVPWHAFLPAAFRGHHGDGGLRANLLPVGLYPYVVGTQRAYLSPCLRSLKFSAIVWSTGDNQELAP